ncbi:MAG: cytochrome c [Alcanivoracaceae bacterium]|nr:cytochrome c [Alcanivoracaceae bacterium]
MKTKTIKRAASVALTTLLLGISTVSMSQSACIEQGALAWENWTKIDAGGSGLPVGVESADYVRCKACHGWDKVATDVGYVRRSRKDSRSNAGAGDGDQTSRSISPFMGGHDLVTADDIAHAGIGRSYADGKGSWEAIDSGSASNKAGHSAGYTLGNQHPDFSAMGLNAGDILPTQAQLDCLTEFINFEDGDPSAYFSVINPERNPVLYTINSEADTAAGEAFYNQSCIGCHGDPATDHMGGNMGHPSGGILAYLASDGKFREFAHKARWGIADTIMTRAAIQSPSSENIRDMMLYLQDLGGTGFTMTNGLNGVWWNAARSGEGYQFEVFQNASDEPVLLVFFYTYDTMGNQVFMVATGPVNGNSADVSVVTTSGGVFGDDFDPNLVESIEWGTGVFTANGCSLVNVALTPNADAMANGFTDLIVDLERFLPASQACP